MWIYVYTPQNAFYLFRSISGPKMGHYEGKEMNRYVGFKVLTAVVMKSSVFWDTMVCSSFRGTSHLHLQVRRISQARNQHESRWQGRACSSETSVDFK
jgi:hypothetical protein